MLLASVIRYVRRLSLMPVAASFAAMAAALVALGLSRPSVHVGLVVYGFIPLFVGGVAVSYAASGLRPSRDAVAAARLLGTSALASLAPLLAVPWGRAAASGALALAAAVMAVSMLSARRAAGGRSIRLSLLSMAFTYASTAVYSAALALYGSVDRTAILGLLYALPVQAIYSVTIHSLPSTYGERASGLQVALMHSLVAGGLVALFIRPVWGAWMLTISAPLYFLAARVHRVPRLMRRAMAMDKGPARSSHLYFLVGHIYAAASWAWLAAVTGLWVRGTLDMLAVIHALAMGFIGVHIYIHAPMMLPVLLGTRTLRRYGHTPFILLLASTLAWPLSGEASMILFLASLATLASTVKLGWVPRHLLIPL